MNATKRNSGVIDVGRVMNCLFMIGLLLGVAGCKTHYDATAEFKKHPLEAEKRGYVAMADDAVRGNRRLKGSGPAVSDVVYQGFTEHLKLVIAGNEPASQEANFAKARQQGCDYLIVPSVVKWVNEDNEFGKSSGNIAVSIQVYEVPTKEMITSVILKTKGSTSPLEDQPADQLTEPLEAYLEAIFKK